MNIAFLALGTDLAAMSSRALSAYARQLGGAARIVFVPSHLTFQRYSAGTLERIADAVQGCDVVGLTVFTSQYRLAAQITDHLKSTTRQTVLWGGIHAMIRPYECLQHADGLCMGEGEPLLEDLAQGKPFGEITGLWHRQGGSVVERGITPMARDVSALPFQDFSFENHWYVDPESGAHGPMTREVYAARSNRSYIDRDGVFRVYYKTMASRGCPYSCGYCNNSVMHDLYTNKHFRRRSVERFMAELEEVHRANPFIELIHLADDTFLNRSAREIQEFARLYKERIGLPMRALTTPTGITEEKLEALVDAGLCHLYMGIESGSPRALERYRRPVSPERIMKAARLLNQFQGRLLTPKYDVICSDPLATDEETRENILFLTQIPRPRIFQYYTLGLFHGTLQRKLVEQAGLSIADDQPYDNDYFFGVNPHSLYDLLLLHLNLKYMPDAWIRFLAGERMLAWSHRWPWVNRGVLGLYRLLRGLESGEFRYRSAAWHLHKIKRMLFNGEWAPARRLLRRFWPG
ncbi:MAG: radical SAM protein [Magnetococcales bacterium]|nr:radical SAM protein [Magnetococcales bacterium]